MYTSRIVVYLKNLNYAFSKIFTYYLIVLLVFTVNRLVLLYRFMPEDVFPTYGKDLLKVFWFGSRFDTQAILYTCLPLVLFAIIFSFYNTPKYIIKGHKYFFWYSVVMSSLLAFLLFCDQQYYAFFQSHYNPIVFGIVQDDTAAVMKSMWTDHPVLRIILLHAATTCLMVYLFKKANQLHNLFTDTPIWAHICILLTFAGGLIIGMRGSLGDFPLEKDDCTVSDHAFLNFLTPNAVFSLQEAVKERQKVLFDHDNVALLKAFGYTKPEQALAEYLSLGDSNASALTMESLYATTAPNTYLETKPPNVVFALMESMSNYYLDFHNEGNFNLLGSLAPHFKQDHLFRNFISDENGTIPSLEGLITQIPFHPIAQTRHKLLSFPSSVALAYRNAGYETVFVTGGKLGWRNLDEFIPKQGFDKVASMESILREVPGAQVCEWGVYDEYLFKYVSQLLHAKSSKPKFIFFLTTTNHTPFERPAHYKPQLIQLTDSIMEMCNHNAQTMENFINYQYSSNCLGDFIADIKSSELANETIIGATGDHNNWMLFQYDDKVLKRKYGVPFYMYVPPSYLVGKTVDIKRYGSHKDIFPTLINLSLSKQKYFNSGNDLLSSNKATLYCGINENKIGISDEGAVLLNHSVNTKNYVWTNAQQTELMPEKELGKVARTHRYMRSRKFLLSYYFNEILSKN